ncbi:MAG TPA: dipeptidase [Sphingomonas sp.]|nr:dipeptidase [Sphingomonas sp.]
MVAGLLVVALVAAAFFVFAPAMIENSMNKVERVAGITIRPEARALHARLAVVDLHADPLLWKRDLNMRSARGQVDVPRLIEGGYALQLFSSVTKTPKGQNYDANPADTDNITLLTVAQLQPPRTWTSLLQRSLYHAEKLDRYAASSGGRLLVVRSAEQLDGLLADRSRGRQIVGGMLSIEGLQNLEGDLRNLDRLHAAGFRMAGMVHFFDNEVSGSMHGEAKGGLTPLGRQVVRRMEALGMIVDVAHASHPAVAEMLAIARRPVVSSHGGVQATCKVNRNLTDDEIRGIARTGGLVGIGYWDAAICSTAPRAVAAAIAHVRDLVGVDHVGLGSDFDGAVTTAFDASEMVAITQALLDRGFTAGEIRKVMGGNALRVIRAGIVPAGARMPPPL